MQLLAMLTMLVDHVGYVFFPNEIWWRVVGRLAFPLYAFGIVQGFQLTKDRMGYLARIGILAAASQLPFMAALEEWKINVIFTFFVSLGVLMLLDRFRSWPAAALIVGAASWLLESVPFDYGAYALALVLIYRYARQDNWPIFHCALNVVAYFAYGPGWLVQFASILPTIVLAYWPRLLAGKRWVPGWIWRSWYPVHLFVIALVGFYYDPVITFNT